jgi:hypothetical protein
MHRASKSLFFILCPFLIFCQELNLQVSISAPALTTADPRIFRTLEREISEFYNNRNWTDDRFDSEERIEGTIQININEDLSATSFVGTILVSSARPVFNSNYTSTLLNHIDKNFRFQYEENTPLRDNTTAFTDNLSSILTFYAYIILGYDYDSFSEFGGDKYFKIAQNISSNIPPSISTGDAGWNGGSNNRNRYWLIENILNPRLRPYRVAYYDYHRKGLDVMADNAEVGKTNILKALKEIDLVNRGYRNSMLLQMFSDSKRNEIVEVFRNSLKPEQREVYNILATIDPAQSSLIADLR